MHYINWTEGKKRKLRELIEGGTSYNQASKVLKMSPSTLCEKCAELGIHKPKEPTGTERILLACDTPNGLDSKEISMASALGGQRVGAILKDLIEAGKVHSSGKSRFKRYFASIEAAKAYELRAEQEEKARKLAAKAKIDADKRRRAAEYRLAVRIKKEQAEREAQAAIALPRPLIVTPPPVVEIVQGVKVTRYQTPPNLFDFTPPPGWRGEISKDWMNRRMGAAS